MRERALWFAGKKKWGRSEASHLFDLENVLVEVVLEAFVGEIDAELFEAVALVVFEAKDV